MPNQYNLMKDRRFLPLFGAMFFGAFNDNLFKALLVVLIAYDPWNLQLMKPEILVSLAAGLFILPYVLIAPLGGTLADKFDKGDIMRLLKIFEIGIVLTVIAGLYFKSLLMLFCVLFALGVHSALFSPSKFAILPQHMHKDELIGANALLNTGTFIAILLGNLLGSFWGVESAGHMKCFILLLLCASIGFIASRFIPPARPPAPNLKLRINILGDMKDNFTFAFTQNRTVIIALLGIAWFYFIGGTFLAQFPNFTRQTLGADNIVLGIFMAVFTIGIALGGLLNNHLLQARISAVHVPWAALGIAVFPIDLYFASQLIEISPGTLLAAGDFFTSPVSWRILLDVMMLAVCGGLYVVPLNAILQDRAAETVRARILSVDAVLNALFGLAAAILAIILFGVGWKVEDLFLLEGLLTLPVALYFLKVRSMIESKREASV